MNRKIVIFSGPTATGKTSLSIQAAKAIKKDVLIINFDSLAFYKELLIGSARVGQDEMQGIQHELVGTQSISEPLDAFQFTQLSEEIIKKNKDSIIFLVGGSGFYIRALIKGMYEAITTDEKLRNECDTLYKEKGIEPFIDFLKKNDPKSLENLHPNDHYRLMRAVEFYKSTGKRISESKNEMDEDDPYDFNKKKHDDWDVLHFYLDMDKDKHFELIQKRTSEMLDKGLIHEVESLLHNGFTGKEKPLLSVGYKETQSYLNGEITSLKELHERISISTRQLAKAQRTFFKKIKPKINVNPLEDIEHVFQKIDEFIK